MDKAHIKKITFGLYHLLIKRLLPIWIAVIVILISLVIPYQLYIRIPQFSNLNLYLRISGFVLQLFFITIVVIDINALRKKFERPGTVEIIKQWFDDFLGIFKKPIKKSLSGTASMKTGGRGSLSAEGTVNTEKTIDERVDILENKLEELNEEVNDRFLNIETEIAELERSQRKEIQNQKNELKKYKDFNEKISTSGFKRGLVGLAWLFVGLLLSIFPAEIAYLLLLIF